VVTATVSSNARASAAAWSFSHDGRRNIYPLAVAAELQFEARNSRRRTDVRVEMNPGQGVGGAEIYLEPGGIFALSGGPAGIGADGAVDGLGGGEAVVD